MSRRVYPLLYAVLAIAAVVWLVGRFGSPQGKIHRQLDQLAEVLAKDGAETAVDQALKGQRLGEFFARDFTVDLGIDGQLTSVGQVARLAAGYRSQQERIAIAFDKSETTIQGAAATTLVVGRVSSGVLASGGSESFRLRFDWRQDDGEWKIARLEVVEMLGG